jgi:hypothetical protein
MNESANFEISGDEAVQAQAEIERLLKEIERANERMRKTHTEIERSKTRTQVLLAELAELRAA